MAKKKGKAVPSVEMAVGLTVQEAGPTGGGAARVLLMSFMPLAADECPAWWTPARDDYLRAFWPTVPYLPSIIYSIAARNAAFRFELTGEEPKVELAKRLLAEADLGKGWQHFVFKTTVDLLTQDNGAFIEIIRPARAITKEGVLDAVKVLEGGKAVWKVIGRGGLLEDVKADTYTIGDNPADAPVGIAHLDAGRCTRTGDMDYPVVYLDRKNQKHKMAWWQVIMLEDMPSPIEEMNGVGYCAVSRAMRASQIIRDIAIYKQEKVSGRWSRSIYLTNVDHTAIRDAVEEAQATADARGLSRYIQPIVAQSVYPEAPISLERIDLASLPDAFDEEATLRWYITEMALDFGVDYGFLAPLPGSGLGTATQSETMERQSKGKSSQLFMETIETQFMYHGVLPPDVSMEFQETDYGEETQKEEAAQRRAETRKTRIESGEITTAVARQLAVDDGDLDAEYLDMMAEEEESPEVTEDMNEPEGGVGIVMGTMTETGMEGEKRLGKAVAPRTGRTTPG